jgi:hypothetical protein
MTENDLELEAQLRALFEGIAQEGPELGPQDFGSARRRSAKSIALAAVLVAASIAAISVGLRTLGPNGTRPPVQSSENSPMLVHADPPVLLGAEISTSATLELRHGCLYARTTPVVWPHDAVWDAQSRRVSFTREGETKVVRVDGRFPPGLGGGLMPLELASKYLDTDTLTRVRACLPADSTDLLLIN